MTEHLCQDLNAKLSQWFASRPDARYIVRKYYARNTTTDDR
jgi:hypothetical protein